MSNLPMRLDKLLRTLLLIGIVLGLLAVVAVLLYLLESTLSLWERLQAAPGWLTWLFIVPAVGFAVFGGWLLWRLLRPRRRRRPAPAVVDEASLEARLAAAEQSGLDMDQARRELELLAERRAAGTLYLALLGDISSGKSTLINALLPDARLETSPVGGTTRRIEYHRWRAPSGDEVVLADAPGLAEADGTLDTLAREEAERAHVVIYVCDGDLTRAQYQTVQSLIAIGKPLIVALNKTDRYTDSELAQIRERLQSRLRDVAKTPISVTAISAGGVEEVVRRLPDGREETVTRERPATLEPLLEAVQQAIESDPQSLDALRDSAVLMMAARKLERVEAEHRLQQARELVRRYTRRAVVGALAAVSPGTDVLIQGYLGSRLVKSLCRLYGVPARDLDIDRFLDLSQSHVGRALPILLAIAGNAFKAFPGIGTITGGLVHAVAYGLIFDALGRSLVNTLETGAGFRPVPAANQFKEKLGEDLAARTRDLARLALEARRDRDG